jgi:hypothetical protein
MYPDSGQICDTATCYRDTLAPIMKVMPVDLAEVGMEGNTGDSAANALLDWMDSQRPRGGYYAAAWNTWSNLIASYNGTPDSPWGIDYKRRLTGR